MPLYTVEHIDSGATVDVFGWRPTIINGKTTVEFLVFDIRTNEFGWVPGFLFQATGNGYTPTTRVQAVLLDKFNATVDVGGSAVTFTATVQPADAENKNVTWSISNANYATITPNGLTCDVAAVKPGRATLTCISDDNNRVATAEIFIPQNVVYVNDISFLPSSPLTLGIGEYSTLTALTAPSNAENRVVSFAIIDGGDHVRISPISNNYITVVGLEEGVARIRATALDNGGYSADYIVNVVSNTIRNVATYDELASAAADTETDTINVTANIDLQDTVTFNRTVVVNGGNHIISNAAGPIDGLVFMGSDSIISNLILNFNGTPSEWEGFYGLQVYNAENVHLNTLQSRGDDGGFLINASTAIMTGTINVSDNEFGGIEVSRGAQGVRDSILYVNEANLVNTSEVYSKPTIWVENGQGTVIGAESLFSIQLNNQTQYYLDEANTLDPDAE